MEAEDRGVERVGETRVQEVGEEMGEGRQTCREGSHAYLSDGRQGG